MARRPVRDDEVPEADALEQAAPVVDVTDDEAVPPIDTLPVDASEGDALEQAMDVGIDDDRRD